MNHKSSRSHSIFRLRVKSSTPSDAGELVTESLLNFVDLAGSEKLDVHESPRGTPSKAVVLKEGRVKDNRIKETKYINKSLFFLTQVISQLGRGKHESHVPYRNSTLTKLLKNSLGGNAKTLLVLCISPGITSITNSISTLRFGFNARRISNHIKSNVLEISNIEDLKSMIKMLESKVTQLEVDRIKERNQGEELIDMVRKLMGQKKDLLEKMNRMELQAGNKLGEEERAVVRQAVNLQQEIDLLLQKHQSNRENDYQNSEQKLPYAIKRETDETERDLIMKTEELSPLRRQNSALIHSVKKLRNKLVQKSQSKKKSDRLLAGLLEDSSFLNSLSDEALRNIKRKLQNSIENIDEQLITRKIAHKLTKSLAESEVFIETPVDIEESISGLVKRPPTKGVIMESSIQFILEAAELKLTPTVNSDELLPLSLRPHIKPVEISNSKSETMNEEDLLADGSIYFNIGNLSHSQKKLQKLDPTHSEREEQRLELVPELQHTNSDLFSTPPSETIFTQRANSTPFQPVVSQFFPVPDLATQNLEAVVSAASGSSSKNVFKITQTAREPLKDMFNQAANNSTESNKMKFATPGSKGTSVYYFTTRKNEFEFSFDKNVLQIERNLGSALHCKNIKIDQISDSKENQPTDRL